MTNYMQAVCGLLGRLLMFEHWWVDHPGWGIRTCRICSVVEKAFYDKEDGLTWEKVDKK